MDENKLRAWAEAVLEEDGRFRRNEYESMDDTDEVWGYLVMLAGAVLGEREVS